MPDLRDFGGEKCPLHASALQGIVRCPWRAAMEYLSVVEDSSGPAADTGSATHRAVAEWHRNKDLAAAISSMREGLGNYPLADLDEAAAMFLLYTRDPRNRDAQLLLIERKIDFTIAPAPDDPTQERIQIIGTLDQVRLEDGLARVWDLKTSKRPGRYLLNEHQMQLAAYTIGACRELNRRCEPGGLICPRHYPARTPPEDRPEGVFFGVPWFLEDTGVILNGLRAVVANIRRGLVWHNAGEYCAYCPARSPDECVPRLKRAVDQETLRLRIGGAQ